MDILICDDHKIVRDGLRRILEQYSEAGLIDEAANGSEVLDLFNKGTYDLLLLDISMPDQSGLDVLQAVREIAKNGKYISQSLAHCLAFQLNNDSNQPIHEKLSDREFEIMIKIVGGKSLKEIGNELCISSKTVSTYRSRIMEKMKLESNTDLARYCIENHLV